MPSLLPWHGSGIPFENFETTADDEMSLAASFHGSGRVERRYFVLWLFLRRSFPRDLAREKEILGSSAFNPACYVGYEGNTDTVIDC